MINTGTGTASFVKITVTLYDSNGFQLESDYTYLFGNLYISSYGYGYETALGENEYGSFKLYTNTSYNLIASYYIDITYSTYSVSPPSVNLAINGTVETITDYLGYIDYSGDIINNGNETVSSVHISFTTKNVAGLVIDVSFTYIDGDTCTISGVSRSKCLAPSSIGSFTALTLAPSLESVFYYYTIYHNEYYTQKPSILESYRDTNFTGLSPKERSRFRDRLIDKYLEMMVGKSSISE